jgi:hypothetical protein
MAAFLPRRALELLHPVVPLAALSTNLFSDATRLDKAAGA